jgi:hypothetical protein
MRSHRDLPGRQRTRVLADRPRMGRKLGLLSSRSPQRLVDPVLPAGARFLEMFQHVLIYAQGDQLFNAWESGFLRKWFCRLCRCSPECGLCSLPRVDRSSHSTSSGLSTYKSRGRLQPNDYRNRLASVLPRGPQRAQCVPVEQIRPPLLIRATSLFRRVDSLFLGKRSPCLLA